MELREGVLGSMVGPSAVSGFARWRVREEAMFSNNLKIENSTKIVNSIEDGKFLLLLNRIAQCLSADLASKPFTEVEEAKLESSLELSKSDVRSLVDGVVEIFLGCCYHVVKPSLLGEQLTQGLCMDVKKSEIFVQVWSSFAKSIIDNLKHKIYFPQVEHLSYTISVESALNSASKEKIPKAQLQLGLSSVNKRENISLEFEHDKLYEFYKKLEQVQGQLDAIT